MQIQTVSNLTSNQNNSFGAIKLDNIQLLKRVKGNSFTPVKAHFNQLDFNNPDDIKLMYKIKNN